MNRISNLNSVHIKSYGETLALLKQLDKMGLIKSKSKSKKKPKMIEDIKQDSDMIASVKTLEGKPTRGDPNLFALRQIEPGMSEQDIRDLRERNAAGVATLRAEVQQQRLEDIEAQQGQRFADITRLGGIMNPILERFRGAQDPGAGQRVDPFTQSSTIFLPDIQEETFTETLNEGGPRAQPQFQTELFAEGEEAEARLGPQERLQIGGGTGMSSAAAEALGMPESFISKTKKASKPKKKVVRGAQDAADELGLGKIPTMRNTFGAVEDYYIALTDQIGDRDTSLNSKSLILQDIDRILKGYFL
jgi:hypothetical protein